jgi:hypothetical protein
MLRPNLKSEQGALSLKAFQFEFAKRTVGTSPCSFVRAALHSHSRAHLANCMHGLEHHAGARRQPLRNVWRKRNGFPQSRSHFEGACRPDPVHWQAGEAAKVKTLVNIVMNINTAGLAEGGALGVALGLNLNMLRDVFSQTGSNPRVVETDSEDTQNREHSCFFSAARRQGQRDRSRSGARYRKTAIAGMFVLPSSTSPRCSKEVEYLSFREADSQHY